MRSERFQRRSQPEGPRVRGKELAYVLAFDWETRRTTRFVHELLLDHGDDAAPVFKPDVLVPAAHVHHPVLSGASAFLARVRESSPENSAVAGESARTSRSKSSAAVLGALLSPKASASVGVTLALGGTSACVAESSESEARDEMTQY